jgi:hypothetical protein
MIKLEDATIEQILSDISYWEDPDQALLISSTRTGVYITCPGSYSAPEVESSTLREGLIQFMIQILSNKNKSIDFSYYRIDWETALNRLN